MRVLHVMEATIGGTRRHLVDVAREQNRRGLDVHLVVATERDPDFPRDLDALEAEGVGVTRLPMVREVRPLADARDYRALKGLLRELQPDIVHTHSSKAGVLGRQASLATGIGRRVHTPHTFAFLFEALFSAPKRALYRAIETRFARNSDIIIAVSPTEAATFARSGVVAEDKIRIVPNGIDPARFQGVAPFDLSTLDLDPAKPTAAVIGLVYPAKGQDLALEALAAQSCEQLQLLIVGPDDMGDSLGLHEQAQRLGVERRVRFLGARRDVPELLAALDFLLLPSRWEGMPYVVLEAMASRRPVVATPVDGARDLVVHGETGFLAQEISADALSVALAAALALSPAERAAQGQAGEARMQSGFTIQRMVGGLEAVYAELA